MTESVWFEAWRRGPAAFASLAAACLLTAALSASAAPKDSAGLKSISITPATPAVALGLKQPFTATGVYGNGTTQDLTSSATWSSSAPAIATVSNAAGTQGLATTVAEGKALITAAVGGVSGSTTLLVAPPALVSIAVTPTLPSIVSEPLQFAAIGTYTNGSTRDLTGAVAWASGTPAVATIAAGGLATPVAEGRTTIMATLGGIAGATSLIVTPDITKVGSTSAPGSLLVFPRIDVANGVDTLVSVANPQSVSARLRCYYHTPDRAAVPSSPPAPGSNHWDDFYVRLTPYQTLTWSAATGLQVGSRPPSGTTSLGIAPPFGAYSDGTTATAGALTCFAVGPDGRAQNANALSGSAAIVDATAQAWAYSAWAFEALEGTGASVPGGPVAPPPTSVGGVPTGSLLLNGRSTLTPEGAVTEPGAFAACRTQMLATFTALGAPGATESTVPGATSGGPLKVTLAACTQDLTSVARSTVTRYLYTFWNEDETMYTGNWDCGTDWYETSFPATPTSSERPVINAQYFMLHTQTAIVRIESVGTAELCPGSQRVGFVGVISQAAPGGAHLRGTNMIGRGAVYRSDVIRFEPEPAPLP